MKKTSNKSVLKKCARKTGPYSGPYAFFDFSKISPAEPVADIPVNGKTVLLYKWRARCIKIDSLDTVKLTEASQYSLKDGVKIAGFSDQETRHFNLDVFTRPPVQGGFELKAKRFYFKNENGQTFFITLQGYEAPIIDNVDYDIIIARADHDNRAVSIAVSEAVGKGVYYIVDPGLLLRQLLNIERYSSSSRAANFTRALGCLAAFLTVFLLFFAIACASAPSLALLLLLLSFASCVVCVFSFGYAVIYPRILSIKYKKYEYVRHNAQLDAIYDKFRSVVNGISSMGPTVTGRFTSDSAGIDTRTDATPASKIIKSI